MSCEETVRLRCELENERAAHKDTKDRAVEVALRLGKLEAEVRYALQIRDRQHVDDYAYDDCWPRLRKALEEEGKL